MRVSALALAMLVGRGVLGLPAGPAAPGGDDLDGGQVPLVGDIHAQRRELRGRFLHLTDLHPDPFYVAGSSVKKACHRKKPKKKKKRAGYWGTPYEECDSPWNLIELTFETLEKKWVDEIDFVVWTGDNARHDNDRKNPRTTGEINELNKKIAKRMEEVFVKRGVPVVPSLGNNDVWPHNILLPGPNSITNNFASMWRNFIPFPYLGVFQRGAYFSVEVVPDRLAVVSLNTMYFYDSNKAVGGCTVAEADDPGNLQFDWLEVQLKGFRERGMQVWLTGHVPPEEENYFPECYVRYVELALRFQDTILGHLYGHMNADHFSFLKADDLSLDDDDDDAATPQSWGRAAVDELIDTELDEEDGAEEDYDSDDLDEEDSEDSEDSDVLLEGRPVHGAQHGNLYENLLGDFATIPAKKKVDLDEYSVVNVAPAVVPNPYTPGFRIFSYNISSPESSFRPRLPRCERSEGAKRREKEREEKCKDGKCRLAEDWHSDADAPSRRNTLWTPLGFAQYYIPDLKKATKKHKPKFKLEYATYEPGVLHPANGTWYPIPVKNLPKSLRAGPVESSKYLRYGMRDLTIGSWVELGRRLGSKGEKKLRKAFRKYMYLE